MTSTFLNGLYHLQRVGGGDWARPHGSQRSTEQLSSGDIAVRFWDCVFDWSDTKHFTKPVKTDFSETLLLLLFLSVFILHAPPSMDAWTKGRKSFVWQRSSCGEKAIIAMQTKLSSPYHSEVFLLQTNALFKFSCLRKVKQNSVALSGWN